MPIRQSVNSVGLTPILPKIDYGDPFAGAESVSYASAAGWIGEQQYLKAGRIGTPSGGLDYEQVAALSDLRQISSYKAIIQPLTIPSSTAKLGTYGGQESRAVRTGSLELNMLDLGATVRMASGSFLGLEAPLLGTPGSGGPIDDALQLMSEYNRLPSRILDYAVGLPLAWMGFNKQSVGAKNPDGSTPQPFQQDPIYWNAIRQATPEQLEEMATRAAYATVGDQMAPALKAQLLSIFQTDQLALTSMSSGNERTDYIAKKKFELWQQSSAREYYEIKPDGGWQFKGNADPLDQMGFLATSLINDIGSIGGTILPFGTQVMDTMFPVSEQAEAGWAAMTPEQRAGWLKQSTYVQLTGDVVITLPLFSGLGAFLNFAKAGAAGREFLPLISKLTVARPVIEGTKMAGPIIPTLSESGNSFINVAKQAAWAMGKPAVRAPAILTEGGTVGRVLGGRFAVPELIHVTNIYDGALHVAKLALMEGIASWGINWGLKIASPEYAATYGREIDNSHWVSESSAAAAVDMIGLFTGGTLGAASLVRVTGGTLGVPLAKMGMKASPFNFAYMEHYGGSGITSLIQRGLKEPLTGAEAPFERHVMSVMQRWIQKGFLDHAEMNPDRAAEIMAGAQITRGEAMTQLAKILKAAEEKEWGVETEGWRLQHRVAKKQAQALMNDIADLMETETGTQFWARQLNRMKDPDGRPLAYNPKGLKEAVRSFATMMGKDADALVATIESSGYFRTKAGARAQLKPWQQVANSMMQKAFDRYQGILQGIRNSGTSESAVALEIVRLDHLFQEDARRFLAEAEAVKNGTGDAVLLESLRKQVVETPDFGRFWARQKNWHNEGTRSLDDVSVDAVRTWLEQTEMHLPSKRVLPGDNAVEGELNQLHRELDAGGIWTLAYKATEKTAVGTERAIAQQAEAELVNWVKTRDRTRDEAIAASDARYARQSALEAEITVKYVEPANKKVNDLHAEYVAKAYGPEATRATPKQLEALQTRLDKANWALTKAYDRLSVKSLEKDPELKRLIEAEQVAQGVSDAAAANKPLGYRVGPVTPKGYTADFQEAMVELMDPWELRQRGPEIEADRVLDPTAGDGLYHATPELESVLKHGLLSEQEMVARGIVAKGLGGGQSTGRQSVTYSRKHAFAIASRIKAATQAVNGQLSMEGVLAHFRELDPVLTSRGNYLWQKLRRYDGTPGTFYDIDAHGGETFVLKDKGGKPLTPAGYKRWLKQQIKQEMQPRYDTAAKVAAALGKGAPRFTNEWNRRLNELTAAKPTWGPNGELISPEIKLANGMTLDEANARLAEIVDKYPGDFQATASAADKAEAKALSNGIVNAEYMAKHPLASPTDLQQWEILLDILENGPPFQGSGALPGQTPKFWTFRPSVTPEFEILRLLDDQMDITPGGGVLILGDGSQFLGKSADNVGVVRVSVNKGPGANKPSFDGDPTEVRVHTEDAFVYKALPEQPHAVPIEMPASQWSQLGPEETFVSWVTLRDPRTGEQVHTTTPYLEYPWQQDLVQLGNRNFLARQFDNITAGYRTWRTTEYMKAQTYRLFTTKYEVEPAQIDAMIAEVMRMGYEKWGPGGGGRTAKLAVPLGYQAAANLRHADVTQAAGMIFGRERNALTGEWVPTPLKNKITGEMEVPDYADMLVDGFRQAWTQNFTAAITSKFYSLGSMGFAGQLMGQWLAPLLRYTISPLFKTSELVESAQLNAMRGTPMVSPEMRMEYAAAGMPIKLGQIHSELAAGDMMSQGLMGGLPTVEEAQRLYPNGLADIPDLPWGYGLVRELKQVAEKRRKDSRLPGWMRDGWDNIKDPTVFKDPLAADLSVKVVRDELPLIMRKTNPTAYKHYSDVLGVPDNKLADFIVRDRYLHQGWIDGTVTWQEMVAHHTKYQSKPVAAMDFSGDLPGFVRSNPNPDPNYAYHVTSPSGFTGIARTGFQPKSNFVIGEWSGYPGSYMLRVRKGSDGLGYLSETGKGRIGQSEGTIAAKDVEYLGRDGKWYSIQKAEDATEDTATMAAFYKSQEWQATEAMFRITARTAQAEAFGVHYFGAYRSSLERSLNHPLLGVYPLSWAYKTAKEWYRFLFDNRVFGNGELRLGATPAAYIQSTMQGQATTWAQNSDESLDEWLQSGPLGNAFFMFNLLMPGDWANLPFPASRSIRMILRDGNLNPMDHIFQNLAGPRNQYGMGAIRDFNLLRLAVTDGIAELQKADKGDWSKFTSTLNSNGPPPPFDWDKVVKYPAPTLTTPVNEP